MKILLLGEFSGLYKNLRDGLLELGHDAKVASSGDSWKSIDSDIILPVRGKPNIINKIKCRIEYYRFLSKIKNYDVVQLINPSFFFTKYFPVHIVIKKIKAQNKDVFLSAAGCDSVYKKNSQIYLRYAPCNDCKKYDLNGMCTWEENKSSIKLDNYIISICKGIIPISYEYKTVYKDYPNCRKMIPIPMNTNSIVYEPNLVKNKIVIFHGLNRYGFKGTRFVEKAFEILRNKYPSDLECIIDGHMPLNDYLTLMRRTNVVIDQTYGYSSGVNAVYALAMGKVVMGGNEPEALSCLGVEKSPVINILPDDKDIIRKIEYVLDNKNNIEQWGYESRIFVEQVHNYVKVAQQYVDTWK